MTIINIFAYRNSIAILFIIKETANFIFIKSNTNKMSIKVPICYTHVNDPCYYNNSYSYNGNVFIAPNGSNVVPPSGNAFINPILGVTYSDGVYADSKTGLNPRRDREIGERSRDSSSDSSNKSPSRMAEKDKRRDEKQQEKKQEGGFMQKIMNNVGDALHK